MTHTGRDTYPYNYLNPIELNRYGYVSSNPINWIDPTGLMMIGYILPKNFITIAQAAVLSKIFVSLAVIMIVALIAIVVVNWAIHQWLLFAKKFPWKEVGIAVGVGTVIGAGIAIVLSRLLKGGGGGGGGGGGDNGDDKGKGGGGGWWKVFAGAGGLVILELGLEFVKDLEGVLAFLDQISNGEATAKLREMLRSVFGDLTPNSDNENPEKDKENNTCSTYDCIYYINPTSTPQNSGLGSK